VYINLKHAIELNKIKFANWVQHDQRCVTCLAPLRSTRDPQQRLQGTPKQRLLRDGHTKQDKTEQKSIQNSTTNFIFIFYLILEKFRDLNGLNRISDAKDMASGRFKSTEKEKRNIPSEYSLIFELSKRNNAH